jgi:hypothetical protein
MPRQMPRPNVTLDSRSASLDVWLRRFSPAIADELAHAFVIEQRRRAVAGDKNRNASTQYQRLGMIDLKSVATHQFHGERPERRSSLKCPQRTFKMVVFHIQSIRRTSQIDNGPTLYRPRGRDHSDPVVLVVSDSATHYGPTFNGRPGAGRLSVYQDAARGAGRLASGK